MLRLVGLSFPSTPAPSAPSATRTSRAARSTRRGWRRSAPPRAAPRSRESSSCFPLLLLNRTLLVWRSGITEGPEDAEDSVKNAFRRRARAAAVGRRRAGDQAADRQHRHRRRRRLHAEDAAEARKRADPAARLGHLQDQGRHPPLAAEDADARIRQARRSRHRRAAEMHDGEAGRDDGRGRAQELPRCDRRHRLRHRAGAAARTGADQGLLAADPVQRPGRSTATRPCSATPISTTRRRPPT